MVRPRPSLLVALVLCLGGVAFAGGEPHALPPLGKRPFRVIGGDAEVRRLLRDRLARPGGAPFRVDRLRPPAPAHKPMILNLGGEGELRVAGSVVVDVNLLEAGGEGFVIRKQFVSERKNPIVQADMTKLPFRDGSTDGVVGNRVPFHVSFAPRVAAEAFRVLKPGGTFKVFSISGGGQGWIPFLTQAGFTDLHIEGGKLVGTKPRP